jgi:Pyruvate/2-oxoacid:ferredoxin oxidoreductase delta subunit
MKKCGYADAAQNLSVSLADFDTGEPVSHAAGAFRKVFVIANGVRAANGIISLPKLKTHGLMRITGAVKNQYGCVPGLLKGQYHAGAPDVFDFARLIVDITSFVRPRLYIMDAVMAMEGNGPQSGDPRKLGLLLLARDPVALDAVAARIIGLDPVMVPTCTAGEEAGLGTFHLENIDCVGDDPYLFQTRNFDVARQPPVPSGSNPLTRAIRNAVVSRPAIDPALCTRCGTCVKACPVKPKALGWRKNKTGRQPPKYDYAQCIRCFCCQECCPSRAIRMHTPLLGRLMPGLSYLSLLNMNLREKRERARRKARGAS